uniref:RGS domain-containing protein n=1 Tax=Aplanochytrium stocchinoi TaxID=215587 RepID=A0A7S3LSP7_9STRA|mmetsp:Transcript_16304/g.20915  ORF Transcript_16304/g.20915 Transcript_16304/m.20915 type:complete len:449 (+) Transcript_16304:56-1402(+)|eukprot:CAMPEP_0204866152 /NCGR_PEP_ID=MMETSP1348-20121228/16078_1 /ASSEMBLY_ACC=CAM_ASM_000700 /TAXON_ID=215587 /ORGANISM="Aplanochytrium stocchinoi, Strain GSBS06" /LENGTH=448 /DNA_ID=CAMNT_0052017893 /DNA_START=46 /DNA_END=1392 /DNA_ORIENTATION=-
MSYPFIKGDTATGGWLFILVCILCLMVIFLQVWFYRRGKFQPIRSRFPIRAQICATFGLVLAIILAVAAEFLESNDIVGMTSGLIFGPNFIVVILIRTAHVVASYEAAQDKDRVRKLEKLSAGVPQAQIDDASKNDKDKALTFFIRYSTQIRSKQYQFLAFLVACAMNVTIYIVFITLTDPTDELTQTIFVAAVVLIYIGAIIVLSIKMRPVNDGLGIKQELKSCGYTAMFAVAGYAITLNIIPEEKGRREISDGFIFLGIFLVIFFLIAQPLYRSYQWEKRLIEDRKLAGRSASGVRRYKFSSMDSDHELLTLLDDEEGFDIFNQFLIKEFSSENLSFFDQLKEFLLAFESKDQVDKAEMAESFLNIYETYVKANSPEWVNLSGTIVAEFAAAKERVASGKYTSTDLLKTVKDAEREIFGLIATDSFLRFRRTEEYEEYCEVSGVSI